MRSLRKTLEPNEQQPSLPVWQFFPMLNFLNDTAVSRSRCRHHLPPLERAGSMAALRDTVHESCDRMLQTNVEDSELLQNDQDGEDGGDSKAKVDGGKQLIDIEEDDERREIAGESGQHFLPSIWDKYDRRKLWKSEVGLEKLIEMEKRKLLQCQKEEEDEDLMFFKSFLPDMKTLPRVRKLFLKLKFQEILYNEISNGDADGANTEATGSMDKSM
ncbi:uncharacterized protein [Rhodnius prolixus]